MKSSSFRLSCLLCGLLLSCTYAPEEEYFKEIAQSDPDSFSISLNTMDDLDTIKLYAATTFLYSIGSEKGIIESVEILIDGKRLYKGLNASSSFKIEYPFLKTGVFELKIEFVTTTGTGSLADKLGAEKVQVWKTWTIDIDVDPPPTPTVSLEVVNGLSVVSWNSYDKPNFVNYRLEVAYSSSPKKTFAFTDPETTSWVDSSYAGGYYVNYTVFVQNSSSTRSQSASRQGSVEFSVSYNPADSIVALTLTPTVFYGAFKNYTVSEKSAERLQITDLSQTAVNFKLNEVGYNYTSTITLRLNPKDANQPAASSSKTITGLVIAKQLPRRIDKFHYSAGLNTIIGYWREGSNARLFNIEPSSLQLVDSITINAHPDYSIPHQGVYAYYSNSKRITQVNLLTHVENTFNAIHTPSGYGIGPGTITASHTQLVSYGWVGDGPPATPIIWYGRVYDMVNNVVLFSHESTTLQYKHYLSYDGRFLRSSDHKIYKITAGGTQLVGTLAFSGTWIDFRQDKCDEMMTRLGNTVSIYDANNLSLKRTVGTPASSAFKCYDPMTRNVIFANAQEIYAVDVETNQSKTFKVAQPDFVVMNGVMFKGNREYLKLF